jgi:L-alanine-DL-glutamate epimerase-like enolase superfamily enzyme
MRRRSFLQLAGAGGTASLAAKTAVAKAPMPSAAAPAPMKITRIRFYLYPKSIATFNQTFHIVTIETDQGITGIGEGGVKDTIEQCAAMLIGEDPFRTDHLWQMMFRGYFYPAGREKLDALGALDLALWDIKGKALGVPVSDLLGGASRDYVECYATS